MSTATLENLRRWESRQNDGEDVANDVHVHFESLDLHDWCQVADEGRVVMSVVYDSEVEALSAMSAVIDGIAAAGFYAACNAVADMSGLDRQAVWAVVSDHAEKLSLGKASGVRSVERLIEEVDKEAAASLARLDEPKGEKA